MINMTLSDWVYDVNIYKYKDISYWIHKVANSDNWLLTNFNFNLTNFNLLTIELDIGQERAIMILNTKIIHINQAIENLKTYTGEIKKQSIKYKPSNNKILLECNDIFDKNKI